MGNILDKLGGGDLRSIGRSEEVVKAVLATPKLFKDVFEGLLHQDPRIRARAADAAEKVARIHPELLQPRKRRLINEVARIRQQEVRWHLARMFSYLKLTTAERKEIARMLISWIDSEEKSRIVRMFSLQTLAQFAEQDSRLRPRVIKKLEEAVKTGSPAIVSRSKKLLRALKKKGRAAG
jgi:hypothetical protein